MEIVRFNVNDEVRVRLTEKGREILRQENKLHWVKEDKNGWSTWQLWTLMQVFGPHINIGFDICFDPNIELIIK